MAPVQELGLAMAQRLTGPQSPQQPDRKADPISPHLEALADQLWRELLEREPQPLDWAAKHRFFLQLEHTFRGRTRRRARYAWSLATRLIEADYQFAARVERAAKKSRLASATGSSGGKTHEIADSMTSKDRSISVKPGEARSGPVPRILLDNPVKLGVSLLTAVDKRSSGSFHVYSVRPWCACHASLSSEICFSVSWSHPGSRSGFAPCRLRRRRHAPRGHSHGRGAGLLARRRKLFGRANRLPQRRHRRRNHLLHRRWIDPHGVFHEVHRRHQRPRNRDHQRHRHRGQLQQQSRRHGHLHDPRSTRRGPCLFPAGGTYTGAQSVSLSDTTAGATIYYTLDGSTPTTASARYNTPLAIATNTTVNAIAAATGFSNSPVASAAYTINLPVASAPVFSPAAGTFTSVQTVALTDATAGAAIFYTVDGSTPTTNSARYATPIAVNSTTTINAIAAAAGFNNSPVASATFTINLPAAATPMFSPAPGTYTSAQTVTLADTTTGATIFYTLDGSTPTTASARYLTPLTVSATTTIKAIATAANFTTSAVAIGTFTINLPPAATPTFSPAAGTYTSVQTVSIADATAGATIYYTLDGSAPTTASARYAAPITVSTTQTISAIATASGNVQSAVASATYTINLPPAATPTFSTAAGTFTSAQTVSIADATAGAVIFYTLDGSAPTTSSARYTAPISVSSTETISAIATASGYTQSAVATATYTINQPAAATPVFSPVAGTYTTFQTVTLSDATTAAVIYYTLDGSTPTTSSTRYTAAISVTATETINAIATATGFTQSAVATGAYSINLPTVATPTFSPAGGSFTATQTVTLADATTNAVIYYTLDGSAPTPASNVYSAPIVVSATETINAIATATGYKQSAAGSATYTIASNNPTVAVTLSTYNSTALLAPQTAVMFGATAISPATDQLIIDENQQFQTIDGFGASFTDASAYNLEQVELSSQLPGTLSDLFTRTGSGIGLSFMLSPMGASDESKSIFTYDDLPQGQTDPSLSSFSVAHDTGYIIPLIQAAKKLNPSMKYVGSPWSPPAWMKIGQSIEGGTLNSNFYTPFANYFIKYLQAYQSYGILPDFIAIQNEPLNNANGLPSMGVDEPTALTVTRDYVLPAVVASGLPTRILLYDHNWDTPSYPASLLADPTLLASPVIAGTAWHGYGGPPGAQLGVQNQYPTKGDWETEHSGGTFVSGGATGQFISDFNEITLVMRSSSKAYIKWNLALDQNRGPNIDQLGSQYAGCATCEGIVTINTNTGLPTKTIEYYTLGQYSKFILPGATRVWSSNTPAVVSSAYINPDGSRVLVAFNNSFGSTTFQVQWGTKNFSYTLSAYAAATFVWSGTQTGTPVQSATAQIQGDSFITATGLEVEETTDDTGSYDLGYVVDGATAYYKNVNFGTGVGNISVRVANNGTGGTVEFHLDSPTGQLLGTARVPNTGGYQVWQTVTTPSATASGTHDLYMVMHGTGSIGNVNWFQFQ